MAKEYLVYFFADVNSQSLIQFLDLWFRRYQSYHHRIDNSNNSGSTYYHSFTVNHEINMNFSIALKAMLKALIEPIIHRNVNFEELTSCVITFSFEV